MFNQAILIGRVGQSPELKTTASGAEYVVFSLATSRKWKDKNGERQEHSLVVPSRKEPRENHRQR